MFVLNFFNNGNLLVFNTFVYIFSLEYSKIFQSLNSFSKNISND